MSMVEQLIVLGSTMTGLAVVRAAHAAGIDVTVVDTAPGIATRSRYPRVVVLAGAQPPAVLARLVELARERPSALIADSDTWLRFIVAHRASLDAAFAMLLHPDNTALETCLDKDTFLEWCSVHGFASPAKYTLTADAALQPAPVYPLLVRPKVTRHGQGGDLPKAVEARNDAELQHWLALYRKAEAEPAISQSLLRPSIRQYSIGVARNRVGATRVMMAEKQRSFADQCAGGTYVVLARQRDVEAMAVRLLQALDYFGIAEVEILHDDATGESFVIEVNARPWGQFALSERAGLGLLAFLLRGGAGSPVPRMARWLNFEADAYNCFSRSSGVVRHGRLGMAQYLKSVFGANVFAVWDPRDRAPFGVAMRSLFSRLLGRSAAR